MKDKSFLAPAGAMLLALISLLLLFSSCAKEEEGFWGTTPAPPPPAPRFTENTFFYRNYDSIGFTDKRWLDITIKVAPATENLDSMCLLALFKENGEIHNIAFTGHDTTLSICVKFYYWSSNGKVHKLESGDTLKFFDFRTYAKHPDIFTQPPNHWAILKL